MFKRIPTSLIYFLLTILEWAAFLTIPFNGQSLNFIIKEWAGVYLLCLGTKITVHRLNYNERLQKSLIFLESIMGIDGNPELLSENLRNEVAGGLKNICSYTKTCVRRYFVLSFLIVASIWIWEVVRFAFWLGLVPFTLLRPGLVTTFIVGSMDSINLVVSTAIHQMFYDVMYRYIASAERMKKVHRYTAFFTGMSVQ